MIVFVLSCVEKENGGGIYKFNITDESVVQTGYLPCDRPMYAVLSEGRLHVLLRAPFKCSENGGYFSCKTDFTDCTEIENTLGKCPCHLVVDGSDVYVVNYLSGNIVKNFKRVLSHSGKGVNLPRQEMPHTHFACFSPDKKYVLCCDLGLDTIFIYDRDLNEVSCTKVPDGYGVRHLTFSKDGKYIYAVNELVPSISVFSYHDGKAEYLSTTILSCINKVSTGAAIRLDETNSKLYVSVRSENAIFVSDVNGKNLNATGKFSCGGDSPRDFDMVGEYFVCTNEKSDLVSVMDKNGTIKNSIKINSPLNIVKG